MTQDKITMDRLKFLAVLAEEKFQELHPDVKDGDYVDVGEYLQLFFDIMIIAGVRVPPLRIGDTVYAVCTEFYEMDPPFILEYIVKGLALIGEQWCVFGDDLEYFPVGSDLCLLTREDAEKVLSEKLNK